MSHTIPLSYGTLLPRLPLPAASSGSGNNNILMSNVGTTNSLAFSVYQDSTGNSIQITDFFKDSLSRFVHVCVTVQTGANNAATYRVYRDGSLVDSKADGFAIPYVQRSAHRVVGCLRSWRLVCELREAR